MTSPVALTLSSSCSVILLCVSIPALEARAQVPRSEPSLVGGIELRLLDAEGRALAEGVSVEVGVKWGEFLEPHLLESFAFHQGPDDVLAVEGDGRVSFPGIRPTMHFSDARRAELLVMTRDVEGRRSRASTAWPVDPSIPRPLELRLLPEVELFRVQLMDSLGAPISANEVSLSALSPGSKLAEHLMYRGTARRDAPLVDRCSGNELGIWGWPVEGKWKLSASYIYHGPAAAPVDCTSGTRDVEIALPATGHVQVKTKLPRPFPDDALKAVYHHVASGVVAHWTILDGATNHRLLVGRHAVRLELHGAPLLELGRIEVPHRGTQELAVEVPPELRSFRLFVQDEQGRELPAAQARIQRRPGGPVYRRDGGPPWGVLVATVEPKLDLLVECAGFEPQWLAGVVGERIVRLRRLSR